MGSRRSAWGGGLLVALLSAGASGQEAPPVRLALKDGAVVEGRLAGYADRTYRVQLADGRTREVHEREVTRVDFDAGPAPAPVGPTATLADVLRRGADCPGPAGQVAARAALPGGLRRARGSQRTLAEVSS